MEDHPIVPQPENTALREDNTVALLAYLTFFGFIVAMIMHGNKKSQLGAFHLRQMLGLVVAGFALSIASRIVTIVPFIGALSVAAAAVFLMVLWVLGFVAAINGEQKPVPLVGALFQDWFRNAFV